MPRPTPAKRDQFAEFLQVGTRWMDNDLYGHVNNVAYYSFFDTSVNRFLISRGGLDIGEGEVIGLVVETGCNFFRPLSFPEDLEVGLRVEHLGTSSVRYALGVFRHGEEECAAQGHFVHVYVDRETRRPRELPETLRKVLAVISQG